MLYNGIMSNKETTEQLDQSTLQERVDEAIEVILYNGCADGSHHKQHALDKALKILAGERYAGLVKEFEEGDSNDPDDYYEWETGIPA